MHTIYKSMKLIVFQDNYIFYCLQRIKDWWIALYALLLVLIDVVFTSLALGIPELRPSAILFPDFEKPPITTVSYYK